MEGPVSIPHFHLVLWLIRGAVPPYLHSLIHLYGALLSSAQGQLYLYLSAEHRLRVSILLFHLVLRLRIRGAVPPLPHSLCGVVLS